MMNRVISVVVIAFVLCVCAASGVQAVELLGYVTAEGRYFFNEPLFDEQKRNSGSVAVQSEFYHEWESGSSFVFTPFARFDSADSERSHFDVRELNYLWVHDEIEVKAGISKVFWGVTEFVHLVDIINQTDLVEYFDGEDKLGQPMVQFKLTGDSGVLELYVLPYFRERTFPGENGRFRSQVVVNTDEVDYENSDEERHIDLAVRYEHTLGDWDFGIYHFNGTGREPTLVLKSDSAGNPFIAPRYELINQTGLDIQAVKGSWLLKFESLFRTGQGDDFIAAVTGFEYSFVNIAASGIDLGIIGEWAYDERGEESTTGFDNDIMVGARLAMNDIDSTEVLAGLSADLDSEGRVISLESSRRIGDRWKVTIDAFFVLDSSPEDLIHSLRDDDSAQVELTYYY